jgi:hypothetical protein
MPADIDVRAVVPAYFHPAVDQPAWERLAGCASQIRLVVVNPADGPGRRPDPSYLAVLPMLRESIVDVAGYVDTAYGLRDAADVLDEVARYRDWYGITGLFLDQVSSGESHLGYYAALSQAARTAGVQQVAFNHGTHPAAGYADLADLLGTFEGPWRAYVEAQVPDWARFRRPEQLFHLVYSVPRQRHADAWALVAGRGAAGAFVTDHGGANPWDYLPPSLLDLSRAAPRR